MDHYLTHWPTGWQVDPQRGHIYQARGPHAGRRLGGPDHRGTLRAIRRWDDGAETAFRVHDVVWEAFHGRSVPAGQLVIHSNGDRTDCRISNLECLPAREARRRNREHRSLSYISTGDHHCAKLTLEQVAEIRSSSEPAVDLAGRFGVHQSAIGKIRHGQNWKRTPL